MHNAIPAEAPDAEHTSSGSAVRPAYNTYAIIERGALDLAGILGRLTTDYEIIVSNDGSRDHAAGAATRTRLDVVGRAFKALFDLHRNLDRELVQDRAAWRIPLSGATMRVPS